MLKIFLTELCGGELPLDQEVDVGQVGGGVVTLQHSAQGLQVGRTCSNILVENISKVS